VRLAAAALALAAAAPAAGAGVTRAPYGVTTGGEPVEQVTLANDHGMIVKIIGYGATITDIVVPDRSGRPANVVLGYASLAEYEAKNGKNRFGATIGRYAGRIAGARFAVDGREYRLVPNDGPNALHGGAAPGLDSKLWAVRTLRERGAVGAAFTCTSPDGDQGFPGAVTVTATYRLLPDDTLRVDYEARTTRTTPINLTNHAYFNLAGAGSGGVGGQRLRLHAARYVETDARGIPTGRFPPVAGTPLDFRRPAAIGARIDSRAPPMGERGGYNHAWLLDRSAPLAPAALLEDPASGRALEILTTEPALQVYTGDYIDAKDVGAQGVVYRPRDGVALETMHLSDSVHRPEFPTTWLRPEETFRSTTLYRFTRRGRR
jgi:aldose 1-epimerase